MSAVVPEGFEVCSACGMVHSASAVHQCPAKIGEAVLVPQIGTSPYLGAAYTNGHPPLAPSDRTHVTPTMTSELVRQIVREELDRRLLALLRTP